MEELLRREVPLPSASYDISFDIPSKNWASKLSKSKETINLYLYDIKENRELRTNEWQVNRKSDGTVDQEKPPVRIDLSYLITTWSPADVTPATEPAIDEHHLLSSILETLFKYPFIPSYVFQGGLSTIDPPPEIPATVAQSDGFKDQSQGQFWNAVDQFWKPSIQYVVTIPLDLHETTTSTMVATKVVEYGFIVPVHILSIHPAIREDMSKGTPLMGVDVEATPVVHLDDPAGTGDDQITVNNVDGLSAGDMLMIVDDRKTEFCRIEGISYPQISVSSKLVSDHEEGTEIKRLGLSASLDVKLGAVGPAKSSELQVAGGGIRTLRVGDVVSSVDDPEKVEYFQITGISGHEVGLGSSETIIQLGGIVTNDATHPAPIIGAKVNLSGSNGMSVGETFTDSEGKFAFKSLVRGKYYIKVTARGYNGIEKMLGDITSVEIKDLIIKLKSI
ncbi:MAG: Pvc16 family protein [Euryarchaeota archaeon]|nr:Pvc16 family protein [Euryarchaeota archaeon]